MPMFRIAHLSDPHLNPLPPFRWHQIFNKRAIGYLNWLRKRRHLHDMAVLAAAVADIVGHSPDHVAMTGDITHVGLPQEFAAGIPFMDSLGPREHVSFVPGNHDAYLSVSIDACQAALGPWMMSDDGSTGFPWLKIRGHVAIIGIDSAVPTMPFLATGTTGTAQLDRAELLLHYARGRGLVRVVMVHHAPHRGGASPFRQMTDAAAFEAMLRRAGAELVLHGHNHATSVAWRDGAQGPVPIVGVASASARVDARHERAAWHLVTIADSMEKPAITIARRAWMPDGRFGDGGMLDLNPGQAGSTS